MTVSVRPFDTLLVANRGEIALRIMRSARRLGLRTVAVYSEADRGSPHVEFAERAYCLGDPAPRESYLGIERLLAAAAATSAGAIHPGYGFLAENADFAAAVEAAGLVFVGPPAEAIRLMANKAAAKKRMIAAGVPCIPGYQGAEQDDAAFVRAAKAIGYPLMVKSAAGGGGRGMRLVSEPAALVAALQSARSEAQAAFGSPQLILERAIGQARHIEVQVFADVHGNVVHLGERDCSVQRRHQKLIEETPSPAVTPELRDRMGTAAVAAARAIAYRSAGTLEFLLAPQGEFYFMEMNTRLQVEHGVTELATGLDLVEWQLRVAAGEALPLAQHEVAPRGHAMEVRLCAEDAAQEFLPQTGEILLWEPAAGVRTDAALAAGLCISPYYDSMLGKLIAHSATRVGCLARLVSACENTVLLGVRHNLGFLRDCLCHPQFAAGGATISFIARNFPPEVRRRAAPPAAVGAAAMLLTGAAAGRGWTNAQGLGSRVRLEQAGSGIAREFRVLIHRDGTVEIAPQPAESGAQTLVARHAAQADSTLAFECEGVRHRFRYARGGDSGIWLHYEGEQYLFHELLHARGAGDSAQTGTGGAVHAPLSGRVVLLAAQTGNTVEKGDTLVVLESMKMEHALVARIEGAVAEVLCVTGEQVMAGRLLIRITATEVVEPEGDI